jgi:hypothetical protein
VLVVFVLIIVNFFNIYPVEDPLKKLWVQLYVTRPSTLPLDLLILRPKVIIGETEL